jgi:transcriptional regulator with XRE-family HTH domain
VAPPRRPPEPPARRPFGTADALRALGEVCLARRHELDLGVEQLAGRMGVDPRQVRRIERGQANVTFDTLTALATGLERLPSEVLASVERALMVPDVHRGAPPAGRAGEASAASAGNDGHGIPSTQQPLHRALGVTVATFRRHARMTQRDLASAAGLSLSAIQSVESGRHAPTTLTLETLSKALRCDVMDLFGGRPPKAARARRA